MKVLKGSNVQDLRAWVLVLTVIRPNTPFSMFGKAILTMNLKTI